MLLGTFKTAPTSLYRRCDPTRVVYVALEHDGLEHEPLFEQQSFNPLYKTCIIMLGKKVFDQRQKTP